MTINADGSHAVQPHTANAHTAPARPVRHAVVEEEVLEPLRPVDGWASPTASCSSRCSS